MMPIITINGTGCALMDHVYSPVNISGEEIQPFLSRKTGDGGLSPGRLVFTEELETFSGKPFPEILNKVTRGQKPVATNVGGPSIVSLIHAAQLLFNVNAQVNFYGARGKDDTGHEISSLISQTPLKEGHYKLVKETATAFTDVLSDPAYDKGKGERTFVNNIGAAWHFMPEDLGDEFFQADFTCFGGTALVPNIHDKLTELLQKARQNNCFTIVNTVFDFRNEKKNPSAPWPLGKDTLESLRNIDMLIMDKEESLRLSGKNNMEKAVAFFHENISGAFVITRGANPVIAGGNGKLYQEKGIMEFDVSSGIVNDLQENNNKKGDTTGCGDNFAGGIIASLARQKANGARDFSLQEAISWGVVSGGYTCFYMGGTYLEKKPGEKYNQIIPYLEAYQKQLK